MNGFQKVLSCPTPVIPQLGGLFQTPFEGTVSSPAQAEIRSKSLEERASHPVGLCGAKGRQ